MTKELRFCSKDRSCHTIPNYRQQILSLPVPEQLSRQQSFPLTALSFPRYVGMTIIPAQHQPLPNDDDVDGSYQFKSHHHPSPKNHEFADLNGYGERRRKENEWRRNRERKRNMPHSVDPND